jgi:hypothetical protein
MFADVLDVHGWLLVKDGPGDKWNACTLRAEHRSGSREHGTPNINARALLAHPSTAIAGMTMGQSFESPARFLVSGRDEFVDCIIGRADFEWAELYAGMLRHEFDRVMEIASFEQQNAAQLLFRLRVGSIRDNDFAVAHPHGCGPIRSLQGLAADKVPAATTPPSSR